MIVQSPCAISSKSATPNSDTLPLYIGRVHLCLDVQSCVLKTRGAKLIQMRYVDEAWDMVENNNWNERMPHSQSARALPKQLMYTVTSMSERTRYLIKTARLQRGVTVDNLARDSGTNSIDVRSFETGRAIPSVETLLAFEKVLGCSLTESRQ